MITLIPSLRSYLLAFVANLFENHMKEKCQFKDKHCQTSASKEKEAEKNFQELLDFIEKEQPYLDSELNIETLSQELNVSSDYLKQIINQKASSNFFEFINTYRLRELKKRVMDRENNDTTLLSLAFESGFSSKSSFYKTFKELTGITPSQYLGTAS